MSSRDAHASSPLGASTPIHVRPEFFARDSAIGCALDGAAPVFWDGANAVLPLADFSGRRIDTPRQLRPAQRARFEVVMESHDHNFSASLTRPQEQNAARRERSALAFCGQMPCMKTTDEIRHARLLELIEELGGDRRGMTELAGRLGHSSQSTISQYKLRSPDSKTGKPRAIGNTAARRIEQVCGKPLGWMDRLDSPDVLQPSADSNSLHSGAQSIANTAPGPAVERMVPLISWVQAGMWNEAVDVYEPGYAESWVPVLRKNGDKLFALRVEGDSMTALHGAERRSYPEGVLIIVDPEARQPSNGDRVVARLVGSTRVTFKIYQEAENGHKWLRPINPQHPPIHDEFEILGTVVAKYDPE